MARQAVIFDVDGLLVDTETLSYRAWRRLAADFGMTLDGNAYGRMVGRRSDESVQLFLAACPLPLTPAEVIARKSAYFRELMAAGVTTMPGVADVVTAVVDRGLPYALATSSRRKHAEQVAAHLKLAPIAIAAGDEAAQGKPAPDIYELAARRLDVAPTVCLALEDSLPGCQAALAAGMLVVAVPNAATAGADFSQVPHVYDSLTAVANDLPYLLEQ